MMYKVYMDPRINYNGLGGFLNTGLVNNNLVWEKKSKTLDLGADLGLFKNRINLLLITLIVRPVIC